MENQLERLHDKNYSYFKKHLYFFNPDEKGLVYQNSEVISLQRDLPPDVLSQVSKNLLSGKSLFDIVFPMKLYVAEQPLIFYMMEFGFLSFYADKVCETNDPLQKMKHMITYTLASKHLVKGEEIPLDPVIGETSQYQIGDLTIYTECIRNKPCVILFYGIANNYSIHGYFDEKNYSGPMTTNQDKGMTLIITMKDKLKSQYIITNPTFQINGLLVGTRTINYVGKSIIMDKKNHLYAKSFYNAESQKSIFDKWFSKRVDRFDLVKGFVTQDKLLLENDSYEVFREKNIISYYEGLWCENVMIDGNITWNFEMLESNKLILKESILLSDFSQRQDYQLLIGKRYDQAKIAYNETYENARKDDELRRTYQANSKV